MTITARYARRATRNVTPVLIFSLSTSPYGVSAQEFTGDAPSAKAEQQDPEQVKLDIETPRAGAAHSEDDRAFQLEEVLVVARRKEESLQDSPVAVSAMSEQALKEAGVFSTRDLQKHVPGLAFAENGTKAPAIFIRGVGQKENNAALDPGVGVYINGIYIARTDGQLLDTVDTASIQVLRGPQGTLFGKNNTGGAILVQTIKPSFDGILGNASTRIGNFGRLDGKVSLNVPLGDNIAVRASIASTKSDGYAKNVVHDNYYGDEQRLAATARIYWELGDSDSLDVFLYGSKFNERGAPFSCIMANENANIPNLTFPGYTEHGEYITYCNISEELSKEGKVSLSGPSVFEMTNNIFAVTYKHSFASGLEFTSISSWAHQYDINLEDDLDATEMPIFRGSTESWDDTMALDNRPPGNEKRTQVSQEFQFQGAAFDDRLSYTIGAFFALEEIQDTPFAHPVGINTFGGFPFNMGILRSDPSLATAAAIVDAFIGGGPPGTLPDNYGVVMGINTFFGQQSDLRNQTYAAFSQFSFDFTDEWQLTVGMRQTLERRMRKARVINVDVEALSDRINAADYSGETVYLNLPGILEGMLLVPDADPYNTDEAHALLEEIAYDPPGGVPLKGPFVTKDEETWHEFTPSFTLRYSMSDAMLHELDWLDSFMTYVTVSEGFKAGGFEPRGNELRPYDPERVLNKEVGFKIDAWESRMRLNTAFYQMDYKDIQQRVAEQGEQLSDLFLFVVNAGEATIEGFEVELTLLLTENLTLFANYNLTDATFDEFIASDVEISIPNFTQTKVIPEKDRSAEPFVLVPEVSWGAGINYNWYSPVGLISQRLSTYYKDEIYIGVDARSNEIERFGKTAYLDDFQTWGYRLSYVPSESFNATLYVENLTDEEYFTGGYATIATTGTAFPILAPPRTYGIELQVYF